jgi:hypothetical protein
LKYYLKVTKNKTIAVQPYFTQTPIEIQLPHALKHVFVMRTLWRQIGRPMSFKKSAAKDRFHLGELAQEQKS